MTTLGVIAHTGKSLGDGLDTLRRELTDAGHASSPWREVSKSKQAPKQMRRLLREGVDRVIVWGGDGTVRRCIDTIVEEGAQVDLAIMPAGTANLLANGLGIPIDLEGALEVALHGHLRRIDLGVINGECFAVMAGSGFDALMIRDADADKDRLGRLAYVKAGARHLSTKGRKVRVDVDGQRWFEGRTACVLIGNMGQVFGGLTLFPDAKPDDGLLDVGIVTAQQRLDWVRVGLRAAAGRVDSSPLVEITQGRKIRVRLDKAQAWELDGGDRPKTDRLKVDVLPGRLTVCVPAP
jgi:YegS/Rv2252/BmrU family lipid kinase